MRRSLWWWGVAAVFGGTALLGACGKKGLSSDPMAPGSTPVVASPVYAAKVGADAQRQKLIALGAIVERLRTESRSGGWQARQDDLTGDAAELSGGVFTGQPNSGGTGAATAFLGSFGDAFGLADAKSELVFPADTRPDSTDSLALRVDQAVNGVRVDSGNLLVVVDSASATPRISLVRGRAFASARSAPPATVSPDGALQIIAAFAAEAPSSPPELVIYTKTATPVPAYRTEITIKPSALTQTIPLTTGAPVRLFIDATSGAFLEARPLTQDFLSPSLAV